jgi:hypothetical protein
MSAHSTRYMRDLGRNFCVNIGPVTVALSFFCVPARRMRAPARLIYVKIRLPHAGTMATLARAPDNNDRRRGGIADNLETE